MKTADLPSYIPMDKPILLFDGVCNLCNSSVDTLVRIDKEARFRFASLQSDIGQALLKKHNLSTEDLKSVVMIDGEKALLRSDVPLEVFAKLPGSWKLLSVFKLIPKFLRDPIYNFVATNRYRWFGKKSTCRLPTPEERERFLG